MRKWLFLITEEKKKIPTGLFSPRQTSLQTGAFRLSMSCQLLVNVCLILTIPGLFCLSALIFSTVSINFKIPPALENLENVWVGTWTQSSGERFPCVISSSLIVRSLWGEDQPISLHGGWLPGDVPCFLNVELIQEAEGHGGWLVVASHSWYCLWVLCLPTVT